MSKLFNCLNPNSAIYVGLSTHYTLGYSFEEANVFLKQYDMYITERIWDRFGSFIEAFIEEDLSNGYRANLSSGECESIPIP